MSSVAGGIERVYSRSMQFEKIHTLRDIYDGIRTGTADLSGAPHYFASLFDDKIDDYTQHFRLYAVSAQFMERELRHWAIFRTWEAKFHRGLEPLETHPASWRHRPRV
jgi:hypothetical protein